MKIADIATKNDKDLQVLVADSRKRIAELVIENRTKESKNVKAVLAARKQLARALTVARQRQLGGEEN
ncbi:MAG TPA: 50S ribosomal protein L29 [Candidatus Saccharimonadales bacterium]|nr:50S ribosomal protein L29 [Candidatus Saccharimonadales bacterium]